MSISSPRIAAGHTRRRGSVVDQPVYSTSIAAGQTGAFIKDGVRVDVTIAADFEGQVYVQYLVDGANRFATMSVAVNVDGNLLWKPVATGIAIDEYTGRPTRGTRSLQ